MSQTNRRPQQRTGDPARRAEGSRFNDGRRYSDAPRRNAQSPSGGKSGSAARRSSSGSGSYSSGGRPGSGAGVIGAARFKKELLIIVCGGIAAIVLALFLQKIWPDGFPLSASQKADGTAREISEIHSSGPLRINEVMTADRFTVMNEDDEAVDWIEICNVGSKSIDLEGYQLAKTENSASVFTFPSTQLEPGECLLVYADSKLRNTVGEEFHAPFRLSSGGDTLMLFNGSDTAVDTVNIPALGRDISYARKDVSEWEVCSEPTPGLQNTHENYLSLTEPASDSPVVINEVVARNKTALADANGQYYDYIELYNKSGEAVDLKGWYLSDSETNTRRWRFPEVTIGAGEYLVVFASGLDKTDDPTQLHTNFSLSSEGEKVILSDSNGRRMDEMTFDLMKQDVAYARNSDGSWSTAATPTPGAAN